MQGDVQSLEHTLNHLHDGIVGRISYQLGLHQKNKMRLCILFRRLLVVCGSKESNECEDVNKETQ